MAAIDLTTLDAVKVRAEVQTSNPKEDGEIQDAITGFSTWLTNWCGVASLNSTVDLDEFYNGNGNTLLFLRTPPVNSIASVTMNGVAVPISAGTGSWGVAIHQSKKAIIMRGGVGNFSTFPYPTPYASIGRRSGPRFFLGESNVEVAYNGGPAVVPFDLEYAVRCVVAINHKRKAWQDQSSRGVNTAGASSTTGYRGWAWPPEYQKVFEDYQRKAIIT